MSRSAGILLIVCASLATVSGVRAQELGYAVNQLELSERGSEWFTTDTLDLRGEVRPAIGIVGEWAYRPLVVKDGSDDYRRAIVRNQFVLHPGASLVLANRLRLAVDVPIQAYADGRGITIGDTTIDPPSSKTSLGDIRLGATLRLFGEYGDVITGALMAQVSLPTGSRDSYASDGSTRITPSFLVAGDISWFVYAASAGVTFRTTDRTFERTTLGPTLNIAVSAGLRLFKRLVIGPEFFLHSVLTDGQFFKRRTTPEEGLLGLHWTVVDGFRIGVGGGAGFTTGYGAPDRRFLGSIEWVPPVPKPEPTDRDRDGIIDLDDACPDTPGIHTTDPTTDGCPPPPPPPPDRDHDGVIDADDACPDTPGVRSKDPQQNGCPPPPPDRDHDGVLDVDDACPDEPGNPSEDPKRNGCPPPPDRDKDGILDEDDACPDARGNASSDPRRNGCPKAYVHESQIRILDQVKFKTASAQILPGPDSEEVLAAVVEVLVDHPEITSVKVEGHTDNKGAALYNRKLSKSRAESVVKWLIKHGVDARRLSSEGYGPDKPIDSNDTEDGRRNNRRVEFHIEAQTPVVKELK